MALWASGEYLSVPATIGFITLLGVAVLNGVVLVTTFNQLVAEGVPIEEVVRASAGDDTSQHGGGRRARYRRRGRRRRRCRRRHRPAVKGRWGATRQLPKHENRREAPVAPVRPKPLEAPADLKLDPIHVRGPHGHSAESAGHRVEELVIDRRVRADRRCARGSRTSRATPRRARRPPAWRTSRLRRPQPRPRRRRRTSRSPLLLGARAAVRLTL